jgi:uncharacterized protein
VSRAYLDATVFVHSLGRDEELRDACRAVLESVRSGDMVGETSVLTVEEVVHVRHRRLGDRAQAAREGRDITAMVLLHDVTTADLDAALASFASHGALDARDAVHAAVGSRLGLGVIVSTDADFDGTPGLRRIDPRDRGAVEAFAHGPGLDPFSGTA